MKLINANDFKEWLKNQQRLTKKATITALDEMPSADTETVHASWDHVKGNVYGCTNCALVWFMSNARTPKENEMNYCPRCGAKMDMED